MIKRVLLVTVLTYLGGVLHQKRVRQSSETRCPKCTHFSVQLNNIPHKYKNEADAFMSDFERLYNRDCENGDVLQETCGIRTSTDLRVVKCQTTRVTLIANGIIQFLPGTLVIQNIFQRVAMVTNCHHFVRHETVRPGTTPPMNCAESEIIIHLLLKECTTAGANEPDGCVSLQDLSAVDRANIARQLRGLSTSSLSNATISGEECTSSRL